MPPKNNAKTSGPSSEKSPTSRARRLSAKSNKDTNQLTTNQKKRRQPKNSTNTSNQMDELFKSPGEKAREEILDYTLRIHEMFPSTLGDQNISSLLDNFDRERAIEKKDPVSFEDAISRVRQDIQLLINDLAGEDLHLHFFSPLPESATVGQRGRVALEELEAQWMSRWITPPDGAQRGMDEWSNVIGFVGEYLVFSILQLHIPGFTEENWTSSFRRYAFPDLPFFRDEDSFSDFTYDDTTGKLAEFLNIAPDGAKTFLIEVKTSKGVEKGFTFSPRQFRVMQKMYFEETQNAYVVIKVDNAIDIRHARITRVIDNPLKDFIDGEMMLNSDASMRASWK